MQSTEFNRTSTVQSKRSLFSAADSRLVKRGIATSAAQMGWEQERGGWAYPVFDLAGEQIARRWKAYNSSAQPKYRWLAGTNAGYYHAPDLLAAIQRADGVLIVANGEPGVLTFHAAGAHNVLCVFGESNIPDGSAALFKAWGVRRVDYWPDLDAPIRMKNGSTQPPKGLLAARKWHDALQAEGITFNAYDLSIHNLPEKGDTNDLWQAVAADQRAFWEALRACPLAVLPALPEAPGRIERAVALTNGNRFTRQQAVDLAQAALGVKSFNGKGYSKNFCCPFHDDEKASAGLHESGTLHCFVCGNHPLEELMALFKIDWQPYQPKYLDAPLGVPTIDVPRRDGQPHVRSTDAPSDAPMTDVPRRDGQPHVQPTDAPAFAWLRNGVPDSIRAALIRYFPDSTAPVIEATVKTLNAGLIDPEGFTISDLVTGLASLGYDFVEITVRRVITELHGEDGIFSRVVVAKTRQATAETDKKHGRKAIFYRLNVREVWVDCIVRWAEKRIFEAEHKDTPARLIAEMLRDAGIDEAEAAELAEAIHLKTARAGLYDPLALSKAARQAEAFKAKLNHDLQDMTSTPFPENWPTTRSPDYRAAFARAVIAPGRITQSEIAQRVGIPKRSAVKVMERAGFKSELQFERVQITSMREAKKQAYALHGKIRQIQAYTALGRTPISYPYDQMQHDDELVERHIAAGDRVFARIQVANLYTIVREGPPEDQQQAAPLAAKNAAETALTAAPPDAPQGSEDEALGKHYGPTYDPAWVHRQLKMRLNRRWLWRGCKLIDKQTGEVYERPTSQTLIALFLERPLPVEYTSPLIIVALELGGRIGRGAVRA